MWEAIRSSILKWIPALLTGILSIIVVILGTVFLIIPIMFIWKLTGKSWWKTAILMIILLTISIFIPVIGISALMVIPPVYMMVRLVFIFNSVILRDEHYISAIRYSWRLTENRWWITAILMVILMIIGSIVPVIHYYFKEIFEVGLLNSLFFARTAKFIFNLLGDFVGIYMLSILTTFFLNRDYTAEETS